MSPPTALVTGAGSGIGRSTVMRLAVDGFAVVLVGRANDRLKAVAEVARRTSPRVECLPADLTVDDEVAQLAYEVGSRLGRLDVLVHSAGDIRLGPIGEAPIEALDWQYRVNLRAPLLLTQSLLPMLIDSQGQIVFLNSSAAMEPDVLNGQYAATKSGLKAAADSLRLALNAHGVRVLSVYPGRTASPMQAAVHRYEQRPYAPDELLQPDDIARAVVAALLLPRSAEITDLAIRPMRKAH